MGIWLGANIEHALEKKKGMTNAFVAVPRIMAWILFSFLRANDKGFM
jgi:hypothetical protein